jgi:hypothetical protein
MFYNRKAIIPSRDLGGSCRAAQRMALLADRETGIDDTWQDHLIGFIDAVTDEIIRH